MSANDWKVVVWLAGATAVVIFGLLVWLVDDLKIGLHTLSRASVALTATTLLWVPFSRWAWSRWPIRRLIDQPDLTGTWLGHLQSNWQRGGTGPVAAPIPIVFVVNQTLLTFSLRSFTADREGTSHLAHVAVDRVAQATRVSYLYALRDDFGAGWGTQQGAADLRVIGSEHDEFREEYWTNTKTQGRLLLKRISRELAQSFEDARRRWPAASWVQFPESSKVSTRA